MEMREMEIFVLFKELSIKCDACVCLSISLAGPNCQLGCFPLYIQDSGFFPGCLEWSQTS